MQVLSIDRFIFIRSIPWNCFKRNKGGKVLIFRKQLLSGSHRLDGLLFCPNSWIFIFPRLFFTVRLCRKTISTRTTRFRGAHYRQYGFISCLDVHVLAPLTTMLLEKKGNFSTEDKNPSIGRTRHVSIP